MDCEIYEEDYQAASDLLRHVPTPQLRWKRGIISPGIVHGTLWALLAFHRRNPTTLDQLSSDTRITVKELRRALTAMRDSGIIDTDDLENRVVSVDVKRLHILGVEWAAQRACRLRELRTKNPRPPKQPIKLPKKWMRYSYGETIIPAAGVYVIFCNGQLIYIGSSNCIPNRLIGHGMRRTLSNEIQTPWGNFATVEIKVAYTRRYGDWLMRELRLIRRLRPVGNSLGKRRPEDHAPKS